MTVKTGDLVQYRNDQCRGWLARIIAISTNRKTAYVKVMIKGESKQLAGQVVTVRTDALEVTR